jgi:hypothetical protein
MAQQTNYQGNRYSFPDIAIEGETTQLYGSVPFTFPKGVLQSLNWSLKVDKGIVQGNAQEMQGRTTGYAVGTGSLELLVAESDDWIKTITSSGFFTATAVYFNIRVSYSVNGTDVRTDSLMGCTITGIDTNNQKGNDATTTPFELSIRRIYKNGILIAGDPST